MGSSQFHHLGNTVCMKSVNYYFMEIFLIGISFANLTLCPEGGTMGKLLQCLIWNRFIL